MAVNFSKIENLELLQFSNLQFDDLFHFTTTISGGVSQGNYASLNLGFTSGDNPECVYENRNILATAINVPFKNLFIPYQTHDDKVAIIDHTFLSLSDNDKLKHLDGVDALITDRKNICIGVTTADCVPVLIYDPQKKVLGVAHAGWKGSAARIAAKTATEMIQSFGCIASDLQVGISASISPRCFEVGEEVGDAFVKEGFDLSAISYRNNETRKLHINLWEANRLPLLEIGVLPSNIQVAALCTQTESDRFFSARRQTIHSGRIATGGVIR